MTCSRAGRDQLLVRPGRQVIRQNPIAHTFSGFDDPVPGAFIGVRL